MTAAEALLAGQVAALRREVEQYRLLWEERGVALLEQIGQTKTARAERDQLKSELEELNRRYVEVCAELKERVP